MLFDLLLFIGGLFINALTAVLSQLNFFIPDTVYNFIDYALGYTGYFAGIFPINTFLTDFGLFLSFLILWYSFLIVWWIIHVFMSFITRSAHVQHN